MPARDQDHAGHPRGEPGDPGASGLTDELDFGFDRSTAQPGAKDALEGRPAPRPTGYILRADGAARGNPGPASAGAALIALSRTDAYSPRAIPDASVSEYLGVQTNNVAEYTAVVRGLELARELGARRVELLLDSKLIVEQVHGRWRIKDLKLQPLWRQVVAMLHALPDGWAANHVPRAQNGTADTLCNQAIDRVNAGGPTVVIRRP